MCNEPSPLPVGDDLLDLQSLAHEGAAQGRLVSEHLAAEAPDLLAAYPGAIDVLRSEAEAAVKQTVTEARDLQICQLRLIGRDRWPDPVFQIMPVDAQLFGRRPGAAVCAEAGTLSALVQRLRVRILGSRIPPSRPDLINLYLRALGSPLRLLGGSRWSSPQPMRSAAAAPAPLSLPLFVFGEAGMVDFHGLGIQVFSSEQARTPVASSIVASTGHPPTIPSSVREVAVRYVVREKYGPLLADDSAQGGAGLRGDPGSLVSRILSTYRRTCGDDSAVIQRAIERDVRWHSCAYVYGHNEWSRMAGMERTALAAALAGLLPQEVRVVAALLELVIQSGPIGLVCFGGQDQHEAPSLDQVVTMLVSDYWFSDSAWLQRKSELVLALLAPALSRATDKAAFQPRLEVILQFQKRFLAFLDRVLALLRRTRIVAPDGHEYPAARVESIIERWSLKEEEDLPPLAPALRAQVVFAAWVSWIKQYNARLFQEQLLVDAGQLETEVKQTLRSAAGWHGAPDLGLLIEAVLRG